MEIKHEERLSSEQNKPSFEAMLRLYDAHVDADNDWTATNSSEKEEAEAWNRLTTTKNKFRDLFDKFSPEEQKKLKKYILKNTRNQNEKYMYFMMRDDEEWFRPESKQ